MVATVSNVRPFQALSQRMAGSPLDRTLYDGVPDWLAMPLRDWLLEVLTDELARRVALHLRIAADHSDYQLVLLSSVKAPERLLDIVDATLQLHPAWPGIQYGDYAFDRLLQDLDDTLLDGGSLYRIDRDSQCLVRRIDATVQAAAEATIKSAPEAAADHLRQAWVAAYGRNPDPDKVFNEAIRGVEEVACPLVEKKRAASGTATLGTVLGELGNSKHLWELVLRDKDGNHRDITALTVMMETLWQAQTSRHGGGPKSGRQDPAEAEAGLHLAVLIVQWLTSGVLRRKP